MRVLMVAQRFPPLFVSGAPLQAVQLARALQEDGVAVHLLATRAGVRSDAPVEGVPTTRLGDATRPLGRAGAFAAAAAFVGARADEVDVVHAHALSATALGALAGARGRVPVLVKPSLGGPDGDLATLTSSRLAPAVLAGARRFDHYAVLDDAIDAELDELRVERARRTRVDNGVDRARFRPARGDERATERARHGLPADAPVVAFVGQLVARKGPDLLLDALARVRERLPNAHALLVGDGPLRAELAARGLSWARVVGPRDDPERALRAADVFALPSAAESFGNATVEALATGLPVVVTPQAIPGGTPPPAAVARVVPREGPALADALCALLLVDEEARQTRARAAREWSARFDLARTARAYRELYDRLGSGDA